MWLICWSHCYPHVPLNLQLMPSIYGKAAHLGAKVCSEVCDMNAPVTQRTPYCTFLLYIHLIVSCDTHFCVVEVSNHTVDICQAFCPFCILFYPSFCGIPWWWSPPIKCPFGVLFSMGVSLSLYLLFISGVISFHRSPQFWCAWGCKRGRRERERYLRSWSGTEKQ